MKQATQYRLFPGYSHTASGRLSESPTMVLQFLDYTGDKPVWRSIPKYVAHSPEDKSDSFNLGDLLIAQEYRESDSITSVCPCDNPKDFRTRHMSMIQFPLEDSNLEAHQFIQVYPNILDYLLDVLEQYIEDTKRLLIEYKASEEEYDSVVHALLIKQLHRVTYF